MKGIRDLSCDWDQNKLLFSSTLTRQQCPIAIPLHHHNLQQFCSFFVSQQKHIYYHCVWRVFAERCSAVPFELSLYWNNILLSLAVKKLCNSPGNLHFTVSRFVCMCASWNLYFKGLHTSNIEYDSRLVGDYTDRCLAENPHLSLGLHTASTSTCKLWEPVCNWHCKRTHCKIAKG